MPRPFRVTEKLVDILTKSRYQAAFEGTALGLLLGLIDVHSTNDDWFDTSSACLAVASALGLRHGCRSWQAWGPIGLIGAQLAALRALLASDPFFGFGTIYSQDYRESRFLALRVGMSREEVEAIAGRPIRKVPWNQDAGPHDEEM